MKIKELGEAKFYMGCHVTMGREKRMLTFNQRQYYETIVERFGVKGRSSTPTVAGAKPLSKADGRQDGEEPLDFPYREAVGH